MKYPVIILHGWAKDMTGERYREIKKFLEEKGYEVFTPDMPGFGKNPLKKEALQFNDYVSFVHNYCLQVLEKTKKEKIILVGHSFGGRVAIRFTSLYPEYVKKLILTGASGIPRPLPSLKKKVIYYTTKMTRPLFILPPFSYLYKFLRKAVYYSIGEMDYYDSSSLKKTFLNIYKVSIIDDLEKNATPTLLLWGERDTITPLIDGEYMHEHIKNSKLIVVKHASHKLPYEMPDKFSSLVYAFIK